MVAEDIKIGKLVEENFDKGYKLYYLGIPFFFHENDLLSDVCTTKGIALRKVYEYLSVNSEPKNSCNPRDLPPDLLVEYLKHTHHIYIKKKLPYFDAMIKNLNPGDFDNPGMIQDLKFIYPKFSEDFIAHIYEEEDTVFEYMTFLCRALKGSVSAFSIFSRLEQCSVVDFAEEHGDADDDMKGLRELTNNYHIEPGSTNLLTKVLFSELKAFEADLSRHAELENNVLIPKALEAEEEVIQKLRQIAQMN